MLKNSFSLLSWLMNLFDPPPLSSMTFTQKLGRVALLSGTLVIGSILVAMLGALGLYLMERGRELGSQPEFYKGLGIILAGIIVNTICVLTLVQLKRVDHKLIPPTRPADTEPVVLLKVRPDELTAAPKKPKPTD